MEGSHILIALALARVAPSSSWYHAMVVTEAVVVVKAVRVAVVAVCFVIVGHGDCISPANASGNVRTIKINRKLELTR